MNAPARRPVRLGAASAVIAAVLIGVALRLCQLALVDGQRLATLARRQHSETEQFTPLRGAILDRSGDALALSIRADSVFVRPSELPGDGSEAAVPRVLRISHGQWLRKISGSSPFTWLKRQANPVELDRLRALNISGVGTMPELRRFYPHGRMAAAVIGFAGVDSQGLEGIELAYDGYLRGPTAEMAVERDARGRKFLTSGIDGERTRQGANVELTLDSSLQYAAESELDRRVAETRAKGGLVLMLDPRRGEILALAQNPSFDPNVRTGIDREVLRNRAVTDAYEPGSTMKALLVSAALDHRVVSPTDRFFCEKGHYRYAGHTIHDHHGTAWLSLPEVLQVLQQHRRDEDRRTARREDATTRRCAPLASAPSPASISPGEQAGILRPLSAWKPIDLATASFGQGAGGNAAPARRCLRRDRQRRHSHAAVHREADRRRQRRSRCSRTSRPSCVAWSAKRRARQMTQILEGVVAAKGTAPLASVPGLEDRRQDRHGAEGRLRPRRVLARAHRFVRGLLPGG